MEEYPALAWLAHDISFARLLVVERWLSFLYAGYNSAMVVHLTEIMPAGCVCADGRCAAARDGGGMTRRRWIARAVGALLLVLSATPASADDITVMVSGGFTAAYNVLVARWQRATGHHVTTVYGASMGETPTSIPNRLTRGEPADIVILARTALDALAKAGRIVSGSETDLVSSRIGMAVKAGSAPPDISSESRFKQALLKAESIGYSDSASGVYISTELFAKLGIAEAMRGKSKRIDGTPVGEAVATGEVEIGFQQISELMPVRGITLVGPIPDSVQLVTTFSAGIVRSSRARDAARQLIAYLVSPEARTTIQASGLEPIAAHVP